MVKMAILCYVYFTTRKKLENIYWEVFGFVFLFFKLRASWESLLKGAIPPKGLSWSLKCVEKRLR